MRKASTRLPEQGTQTPSPAPDLIPAETKNQPRTRIAIGTANGGTSPSRSTTSAMRVPSLQKVRAARFGRPHKEHMQSQFIELARFLLRSALHSRMLVLPRLGFERCLAECR